MTGDAGGIITALMLLYAVAAVIEKVIGWWLS